LDAFIADGYVDFRVTQLEQLKFVNFEQRAQFDEKSIGLSFCGNQLKVARSRS
jgi:hypothetical protein